MSPSPNIPSVICAGRIYGDLLFTGAPRLPSFGTETFADGVQIFAGGGAFISAATFNALGCQASLLGVMPAAPFCDSVKADILSKGVSIEYCQDAPQGADPQITVAIAGQDDRAFLSRRVGNALPKLSSAMFNGHSHLHIGELRTLAEHPELLTLARASGMTISLDCGWDDELMESPLPHAHLIAGVDVFLPNELEFLSLEKAGVEFSEKTQVVVKCGAEGAKAFGKNGPIHVNAPMVNAIDTTGAGDAFAAGFLTAWLNNDSLEACLTLGVKCGAAIVMECGGTAGVAHIQPMHDQKNAQLIAGNLG